MQNKKGSVLIYKLEGKLKKEKWFTKYPLMFVKSLFLAFLLTIIVALLIGFRPVRVDGGSMLPTLNYGDVIIIYKPKKEEFKVGDILTFRYSENSQNVTHRIIEIDENGDFWTLGDNPNNSPDNVPISYNQEAGKAFVVGKTFYMIRGSLTWFTYIPNLLALVVSLIFLVQINSSTQELLEKNAQYL